VCMSIGVGWLVRLVVYYYYTSECVCVVVGGGGGGKRLFDMSSQAPFQVRSYLGVILSTSQIFLSSLF